MRLARFAKKTEKLLTDNSPAILTAFGVVGTLTTAYLTGKASFKASEVIDQKRDEYVEEFGMAPLMLTPREKFELLWKLYIPAVATGVGTCACIILANRIGTRRAAAMASAYAVSERAFTEYKEKVIEKIGEKKEEEVRAEVAQDRVNRNPPSESHIFRGAGGDVLCKDSWSGRYFTSDMETIKKAQNDTNHEVIAYNYASLTDFYNRLGLEGTGDSDNLGWNNDKLLEVTFTTSISDDQKPVLVLDFAHAPIRNYFKSH